MDPVWGVVFVAVAGVLGTLGGAILQNRHSERLARAQRESDARAALRERLSFAFGTYVQEVGTMESCLRGELPGQDRDELLSRLARAELDLAVTGTEEVAVAARQLSAQYAWNAPIPWTNPDLQGHKDQLTAAVREALHLA